MPTVVALILLVMTTAALAQTPEDVPQAQVGSLWPFVQAQADQGAMPLSFLNPRYTALDAWKREARAKVRELLHYNPPPVDPRAEVVERVDCGDYTREKVFFNTTPDVRVPAYVLVPKDGVPPPSPSLKGGGPKRHPAILLLHDHGAFFVWGKEKVVGIEGEHPALVAFRQQYYGGRSVANELVKRGYVVMAIDMIYWGERRMRLPNDPPEWSDREQMTVAQVAACNQRESASTPLFGTALFEAGTTWAGVMFTDDLRSVDYLASRPDVDPGRIGCCGLSVGGFRSAHLAGLDPRIKAAVVVGWMCSYPTMLKRHLTSIGFWATVPGLQQYMDLPDVASMNAPGGLMVIMGTQDPLFPVEGIKAAYAKLAKVYEKAGVLDHFQGVLYDGPHEFNVPMQDKAFAWLDRWLKQ